MTAPDSLSLALERLDAAVARVEARMAAEPAPGLAPDSGAALDDAERQALDAALAALGARVDGAIDKLTHLLAQDA